MSTAVLFDPNFDDEPTPRAARINRRCGHALLMGQRLAAATGGLVQAWWVLCLNTDPTRYEVLNAQCQGLIRARDHWFNQLRAVQADCRREVPRDRFLRVDREINALLRQAVERAQGRMRGDPLRN